MRKEGCLGGMREGYVGGRMVECIDGSKEGCLPGRKVREKEDVDGSKKDVICSGGRKEGCLFERKEERQGGRK